MGLVTRKPLASLGQICQIVWGGNYGFKDGWGDRVASQLRYVNHDMQMEATHFIHTHPHTPPTPLPLQGFLALKSRRGFVGAQEANGRIPESLRSGKGRVCACHTPQVRLVSKQTFVLEELQLL